mgnify:CR=1 FL=1|jgi:3'-5' exoribonuclease
MNNVSTVPAAQQLAWAKVMPNTELWELKMPGKKLVIKDSGGLFRTVRPEGELVIISMRGDQIIEQPHVVYGEQDEALLSRHFGWVLPGQEYILCMLWRMLGAIKIPELRSFYYAVLSDDGLMEQFYRAKASHHHHHNYPGGLLEHSYQVASSAASMARQYSLGHASVCICFLGGLLHDLGKVRLFYNDSDLGVCGQHEAFTLMILAKPLEDLRRMKPNLFEALASVFTVKVGRHQPQYLPETIVRLCDKLSAEVSRCRQAFEGMPDYFWYAKSELDDRVYKRLDT